MTPNPAPLPRSFSSPKADGALLERLARALAALLAQVGRRIVGQKDVLDGILTAVFSGGHALLLGVPGLAKTLMVSTVAQALELKFSRIQFTPDLMPSDITGTEIIEEDQATGKRAFRFVRGPVFANIVLADEVNRTPPKTQAALDGRPMPDFDDLKAVAPTVLTHRLVINFAAEAAGRTAPDLIEELIVTGKWLPR